MNIDSPAEEYIPDPELSTANVIDVWQGKQLAPLGMGMRQQWLAVSETSDTAIFMSASLIWMLILGHEAFAVAKKAGAADLDSAWDACRAAVLIELRNKLAARVKIFRFIDALKSQAEMRQCCELAAAILARADKSEPEDSASLPQEESDGLALGKQLAASS